MSANQDDVATGFHGFRTVESFGPMRPGNSVATFAIHVAVGDLTAMATTNLDTASHRTLFIPGFTGSKEDFLSFFGVLDNDHSDRQQRALVSFSQRGQADSVAPVGTEHYRLTDFVDDGCAVLEALGAREHPIDVVGHSFGGLVARRMAIARPDLVRSVALFSSGAKPIPAAADVNPVIDVLRQHGSTAVFRGAYPDLEDEPQSDPHVEMVRLRAHESSLDNLLSIADILGHFDDVTDAFAASGVPVAVVYGHDDLVWPTEMYDEEAHRLGIEPTVIDHAAHSAQIENPNAFADALTGFWDHLAD